MITWINLHKSISMNIHEKTCNVNTLRPRQNGRHFPDYIFKCIFLNENVWILIKIPLNFVPRGPIYSIPALVQKMAWHWPGNKPLSEPMMVCLLTHICITRPQWVKLYGHIITAQCSILFIQNTASHFHGTEYKFSSFFNRIAWHQIYHFIIKVQCVKIGNILSEVIKQWRSQVIIQATWEKKWYSSSTTLSSQNTQRRNSRGMALNLPISTVSGRIPHLNFASADLCALLITHST